jgi:protein-tyrosine phosphatase
MDKSNYDDVIALAQTSEQKKQSTNYFEWIISNENVDVPDPYGTKWFCVYNMLDEVCDIIADKLKKNHA